MGLRVKANDIEVKLYLLNSYVATFQYRMIEMPNSTISFLKCIHGNKSKSS